MINVGQKEETKRTAVAMAYIKMKPETFKLIKEGRLEKGDVIAPAKLAGIIAAKKTFEVIPFCHPILITWIDIKFTEVPPDTIEITVSVESIGRTGVEMEALVAASTSALTIYDMAKAVDKEMEIGGICLLEKRGGKSGTYFRGKAEQRIPSGARAAVITVSDSASGGARADLSGPALKEELEKEMVIVDHLKVVPDEKDKIISELNALTGKCDFIFLTGGTGIGPRDITPEAVREVIEKEIPGVGELLRKNGQAKTCFSFLSRSLAGVKDNTIIVCLPGSPQGAKDGVRFLFPQVLHTLSMLKGDAH